jgi:hypothetical protein
MQQVSSFVRFDSIYYSDLYRAFLYLLFPDRNRIEPSNPVASA